MAITLYGHPVSPYVRKTRLALKLSGIDFAHKFVAPHSDDAEFRAASPLGKIPAYVDEHVQTADSSVILHYLARFDDRFRLLPEDRVGFARACWFEEYADTVMTPVIAGHLFAEVVLAGRLFPREPLQADIDKARDKELPGIYAFLDQQLGDNNWLLGDSLSLADVAVGGLLIALYHCGDRIPDSAPALQAFVQRFFALETVRDLIAEEVAMLNTMNYQSPLA